MSAALRTALFLGLWLVLAGADPAGLPFGLLAAAAACWASLRLTPGVGPGVSPLAVLRLLGIMLRQSVVAGVDIARRVFDPRLPLRPGFVLHMPTGPLRDGFTALASLAPGALPVGTDAAGALVVHALDTDLPVRRDLAALEALYAQAGGARG